MKNTRYSFSPSQLERSSEIIGNISVAWFASGVIAPLIVPPETFSNFLFSFGVSLVMSIMFFIWSISVAKEAK